MLDRGKMVGIVPTTDYEKAREFYGGKLGFAFVSLDQFALVIRVGGHQLRIVKMANFKPNPKTHPQETRWGTRLKSRYFAMLGMTLVLGFGEGMELRAI